MHHPQWKFVYPRELHRVWRQDKADPLLAKLAVLRKKHLDDANPDDRRFLADLCRGRKAWSDHHTPTAWDIDQLYQWTNRRTTIVTCTRWAAGVVNRLTLQVLFRNHNKRSVDSIPTDYEMNPGNYDERGNLLPNQPEPEWIDLYIGMRVVLTRNMNKDAHFVNGMVCTVEGYDAARHSVIAKTSTGRILAVCPVTDDDVPKGRCVYYPLRLGYASTVHKYQGAELDHVTFWPDRPASPAAGYVALSRVRRDSDYLIGGVVSCCHFAPAR